MSLNQIRGIFHEDRATSMRCYDALPPAIREFMRNAMHSYATAPRLGMLRAGMAVAELHEELIQRDMRNARRDAALDWKQQAATFLAAQRPRRRRDWLDKPPSSRL